MSVDEQFEQAVEKLAPFISAPEPAATSITHSLLMTVHFRDYLELRSAVDRLLTAIDDYATGSFGDPQDDCRDILACIDAHAKGSVE